MTKPLINILIRTSNRPNYFSRCLGSVLNQTYNNYRIFISADDEKTKQYVSMSGFQPVMVKKMKRDEKNTAPWNLYLNDLIAQVDDGWIIILDDDDYLAHNKVLERISVHLTNICVMHVWQMQWPTGRKIPEDGYMKTPFVRKHIGMPCFTFHSYFSEFVKFDAMRAGDFRFICTVAAILDNRVHFIDEVIIKIGNTGLVGAINDLKV